jgi:hypothetical protein
VTKIKFAVGAESFIFALTFETAQLHVKLLLVLRRPQRETDEISTSIPEAWNGRGSTSTPHLRFHGVVLGHRTVFFLSSNSSYLIQRNKNFCEIWGFHGDKDAVLCLVVFDAV